jgi:hypothetical protein
MREKWWLLGSEHDRWEAKKACLEKVTATERSAEILAEIAVQSNVAIIPAAPGAPAPAYGEQLELPTDWQRS